MVPDMPTLTLRIRVRYAECDAQNVVFNARYADYADLASTEFLRAVIGGYQTLQAKGYETQLVKLTMEWKAPACFDDVLDLDVCVDRIGTRSFTLKTTMFKVGDARVLVAQTEAIYVTVSGQEGAFQSCEIPDFLRQSLESDEHFGLINQAGV